MGKTKKRAATIKDISREANVSTASVSMVLNGKYGNVSESTKNRIQEIAARLGYHPNRLAQGLVKKRSNTIGLLVPDIANPYFGMLAKQVESRANERGMKVILCNTSLDEAVENDYINVLLEYSVDGIIVTGNSGLVHRVPQSVIDCDVPLVALDRSFIDGGEICYVGGNHRMGAFLATEYLIRAGHRNIAFIGGEAGGGTEDYRLSGYRMGLEAYRIGDNSGYVRQGEYTVETGRLQLKDLMLRHPGLTAVFCANDLIALGALTASWEMGLPVPDCLSIVGYDDVYIADVTFPKLTTVHQPLEEISELAVQGIVDMAAGVDICQMRREVTPYLVERQSVRKIGVAPERPGESAAREQLERGKDDASHH